MNRDVFWAIINDVLAVESYNSESKERAFAERLSTMSGQELVAFDRRWRELKNASYSQELWGAAYLINGGCSDDCFMDFRDSVILMGREVFEGAIRDPDTLALHLSKVDYLRHEGFSYVITDALEAAGVQGERVTHASEPTGEDWEEEDLPQMFPRLAAALK